MNTKYALLLLCIVCTTTFFACTKHSDDVDEPIPTATLTIARPTEGAVYHTGDSVLVQALATANGEMHGYEVAIRNASDTSVVYFSKHVHEDGNSLLIDQAWKDTLTTTTDLQVEVMLILDHDGHTSAKSVSIKSETE